MNTPTTANSVLRSEYQKSVANYWNTNHNDPVNLLLGHVDGYYHHHYGIGAVHWSVLEQPEATRDDAIIRVLHRLAHAQAEHLLGKLGPIKPEGDRRRARARRPALGPRAHGPLRHARAAPAHLLRDLRHVRVVEPLRGVAAHRRVPPGVEVPGRAPARQLLHLDDAVRRHGWLPPAPELFYQVHNDLVRDFEASHRELQAVPSVELQRFLRGLRAWMSGAFEWHDSNPRYKTGRKP